MPNSNHLLKQDFSLDLKHQFILVSDCEIEGKADLYIETIKHKRKSVRVLVIDAINSLAAAKLWDQAVSLVTTAYRLNLACFVQIKCNGYPYDGILSLSLPK